MLFLISIWILLAPVCSFLNIFHLVTQYYGDKLFLNLVFPLSFLLLLDEHILIISLLYLFYSQKKYNSSFSHKQPYMYQNTFVTQLQLFHD